MRPSHDQIYERARCYDIAFGFRDVAAECDALVALATQHLGRAPSSVLSLGRSWLSNKNGVQEPVRRPETASLPDWAPQTRQSDLIVNVSKVASISPTRAPATRQELPVANGGYAAS